MRLGKALQHVAETPHPETLDSFRSRIDSAWIQQALRATGTATVRRRRLPAEQVIWLVLGMAYLRDRAIVEVVDSLDLALPGGRSTPVAPSAVSQARGRLGAEPLATLFDICASHWADASVDRHRWRGLAVYGADGTTLRIADTPTNRAHFGGPSYGGGGKGSYPQLRLVALMALRSHIVVAASFGPYGVGEGTHARDLWAKLPSNSVCVVDRNFLAADVLIPLTRDDTSRHWLGRAKSNTKWRVLECLGTDDYLVEREVSAQARKRDPSLPKVWHVRAIRYQRKGFAPQWLMTSLLDPEAYPAREIIALYHERWELELAYDEIKTEVLDREETLRSRSPERVAQEIWGILLAYNLVRVEMERVAEDLRVEPTRISFVYSLHRICEEWWWDASAAPGAIPRHLRNLRDRMRRYVLPPRRSERAYPRAVKIPMSSYPSKRRLQRPAGPK